MRDVESASMRIAESTATTSSPMPPSRLSDVETKGVIPSVYRMYSLSIIYRKDIRELLSWYGVELNSAAEDMDLAQPPQVAFFQRAGQRYHGAGPGAPRPQFRPAPHLEYRAHGGAMGIGAARASVAICQLSVHLWIHRQRGLDHVSVLPPGTFVQVDESRDTVVAGTWRSEYERPIYFVETRAGHICCWCTLVEDNIILQSHPLSPVPARVLKYPQEADVVGQVVGVAMRLGEWRPVEPLPGSKERVALN